MVRIAPVLLDSALPRLAMSLSCGAALGLSGALAQVALRNPLASPGTLGISSGAFLALAAATLYAPWLLAGAGREAVAFAGGAGGIAVVLALTLRGGLEPATVALAGLAVGLYAGAVGVTLALLHSHGLSGLFVWNAGSLVQLGWAGTLRVLAVLVLAAVAAMLLRRPLGVLALPDGVAAGLGVRVATTRLAALGLSVALAASVTASVGTIGFVGLGAPALARVLRPFSSPLVTAAAIGAALLAATDLAVQPLGRLLPNLLPTGAVTALLGVPLLLWLLRQMRDGPPLAMRSPRAGRPGVIAAVMAGALLAAVAVALSFGRVPLGEGWAWSAGLLAQRAPRAGAALVAGAMLGAAGAVLQRVFGNLLAAPDVLGLGTGTALGMIGAAWAGLSGPALPLAGVVGGGATLGLLLLLGGGQVTGRILLAGIALASGFEAVTALVLASGDPRAEAALAVLSGSTYGVGPRLAAAAAGAAMVLGAGVLLLSRPLDILPLGDGVARALGIRVGRMRALLLLLAAAMTAVGTLVAGPLAAVGLLAPNLARQLGLRRAAGQSCLAAALGALLMVVADWLGRNLLFPAEIPAGLLAAVIGGPALLWTLARGRV